MKKKEFVSRENGALAISEETEPPGSWGSPVQVFFNEPENITIPQFSVKVTTLEEVTLPSDKSFSLQRDKRLTIAHENPRSTAFRQKFFPTVTADKWNDWRWQLKNRITSMNDLKRLIHLSKDETEAIFSSGGNIPLSITPYYASLIDQNDHSHPLRKSVVPVMAEYLRSPGEEEDPLKENSHSPVPGIVHRYPDRVLFLATNFCSTYCRYCTRSHMVGARDKFHSPTNHWKEAIAYIEATPTIRDVLISGGDPLTLPDEQLEWLLSQLYHIPHVEFLRIGTKVPIVLPQRITPSLLRMLKRYHPLWMSLHVIHPEELTIEASLACNRLADAGIPLGSQTVLLSGINDDIETMKRLVHGLLKMRVRPYYLYQCDPIPGSLHFRTSVEKGLEIIRGLRGFTSGYAVPTYVIDAPGSGGKIPLVPDPVVGRENDDLLLKNYEGKIFRYPDQGGTIGQTPLPN